jgi:hypothetical protein
MTSRTTSSSQESFPAWADPAWPRTTSATRVIPAARLTIDRGDLPRTRVDRRSFVIGFEALARGNLTTSVVVEERSMGL